MPWRRAPAALARRGALPSAEVKLKFGQQGIIPLA